MFSLRIVRGAELAEGVQVETRLPETFTRFGVGRDPSNLWPIPDRTLAISARHCEFVAAGSRVLLRDLSTNGTFVNGAAQRLATEHVLHDGDRIEMGPYTIEVRGHGVHAAGAAPLDGGVTVHRPPAVPPARSPSVEATTPLRGGDPAAMLAAAAPAPRAGLTEILRNAPPTEDSKLAVTRIRSAPRPAPAPTTTQAQRPAAAAAPVAAAPPVVTAAPPAQAADPLVAALARGLGVGPEALAGRDAAQAALQVATLARAAVAALHHLLEQQGQARRQLGSHAPALAPVRDMNPLRRAASPEGALAGLLAPGADAEAALQRAGADLAAHQERLLAAYRGAATRLGEAMAPAALEKALGERTGTAPAARLWEMYTQIWHGLGLAPGQPWPQGFVEAALLHLAAAYDEQNKP